MPGHTCVVCGNNSSQDPSVSFHRFPGPNNARRARWLQIFGIDESQLKSQSRVCSRHFPGGDPSKEPVLTLGKRFASPIKQKHPRAKRAKARETSKTLATLRSSLSPPFSFSRSVTPVETTSRQDISLTAPVGEQLETNYQVHELPSESDAMSDCPSSSIQSLEVPSKNTEVLVNTALLARIESLEAENRHLKASPQGSQPFRIEQIQGNDHLVRFYTGFVSYMIFTAFFDFLGPVVNELNYWGSKKKVSTRQRRRSHKLDPKNQFFLTLVKLRLNLKVKDLAFRFGISTGSVSQYITTWICFLYHHLKELEWMPSVEQVFGTLPHAFQTKYPKTYAIIDGTEIFLQTPSDLHMQSSTWSQYKHHNTAKFLIACTPNGAISYVSPVFVGSISDVELTRVSGFLTKLEDKPGISIMADRGFTIRDMLKQLNIELNLPPFMEGRQQLPAEDVRVGRSIATLRIHVERAIGRIKNFSILKETIPLSLSRITNQIVCVCSFLSNFHPALVPSPHVVLDSDTEDSLEEHTDSEDNSDLDTVYGSDHDQ